MRDKACRALRRKGRPNASTPASADGAAALRRRRRRRPAAAVAAGSRHTCALLLADGAVACWGDNGYGQLGLGGAGDAYLPAAVGLGQGGPGPRAPGRSGREQRRRASGCGPGRSGRRLLGRLLLAPRSGAGGGSRRSRWGVTGDSRRRGGGHWGRRTAGTERTSPAVGGGDRGRLRRGQDRRPRLFVPAQPTAWGWGAGVALRRWLVPMRLNPASLQWSGTQVLRDGPRRVLKPPHPYPLFSLPHTPSPPTPPLLFLSSSRLSLPLSLFLYLSRWLAFSLSLASSLSRSRSL